MKNFTPEELGHIREDWRRNANLKEEDRLQRVSELHACTPEDVAEVVRLEHFKQKEAFTKNIRNRTVKSYDQAVKDDCIKAVLLDGESQTAVGERFGIPHNTISVWVKAAKKKQQEFLDYPEPEFLDDLEQEPEQIPVEKPAPEPAAAEEPGPRQESFRTSLVDLKALEEATDGLLTFVDVFEDVGFLTPEEGRKLIEIADQAHHYAAGIRWALERRPV